jgi:hypothetical protein
MLASSVSIASQHVTSIGTGYDLQEARTDAIEKALMRACKSAVVSDKTFRDYQSERNKLIIYNGCLVKNYTVEDESIDGALTRVKIKAEVIHNRLPDRIINNYNEWFFYDFGQHKDRVAQLRAQRKNAKNLVSEIFLDFPHSAFRLERSQYNITYEGENSFLNVGFKISWNNNFINALEDTFDILKDRSSSQWRPAKHNINISRNYVNISYGFDHFYITEHVHQLLSNNRPTIRIRIIDRFGKEQVTACYQLRRWYNLYDLTTLHWVKINASGVDGDYIKLPIPDNIDESSEVSMDVVTQSFCKQYVY